MIATTRLKHIILSATASTLIASALPATAQAPAKAPVADAGAPSTEAALQGLDAYVEKALADWQMPGLSIVIVKDDKIVYAKGFGVRELGKPDKVDADTIFAMGSTTKAFTAAALGMLVDEKKIAWDGSVHDYMPAFEMDDPYVTRHATVRDLLSHRTGVVTNGLLWYGSGFDRNEVIRRMRFQTESLGFRNQFQYQNEMFIAAGEIIPAVTGTSFDKFITGRIFEPLGMRRTNTSVTTLKGLDNVATPHAPSNGKMVPIPYRLIDNVGGAGVINSSARDMAQWVRLQLGGGTFEGKQLIAPATLAEMHTGQIVPRGGSGNTFKFSEYGLGWGVQEFRGQKVVQHSGGIDGMQTVIGLIPAKKLGVIVLANSMPTMVTNAIEMRVFDAFLGAPATDYSAMMLKARDDAAKAARDKAAAEPKPAALPPTLPLDRYAGTYTNTMLGDVTVKLVGGKLELARPLEAAPLEHEGKDKFKAQWKSLGMIAVMGPTPVGFSFGADGQIASLALGTDIFKRK